MVLYEFKLISPMAVKFSQSRVRPEFQDGRLLEDSYEACKIDEDPCEGYDCSISAPFPPIEVVRWRPRVHHDDGTMEYNSDGEVQLGDEAWYTLDNRRLVCLQRKAVAAWPRVACIPVVVLDELPKQSTARKFRSFDYGKSVRVGHRFATDDYWAWSWMEKTREMQAPMDDAFRGLEMIKADADTPRGLRLADAPDEVVDELERQIEAAQEFESNRSAIRQANALPRPEHPNNANRNNEKSRFAGKCSSNAGAELLAMVQPEPKPPTGIKISVDDLFKSAVNSISYNNVTEVSTREASRTPIKEYADE